MVQMGEVRLSFIAGPGYIKNGTIDICSAAGFAVHRNPASIFRKDCRAAGAIACRLPTEGPACMRGPFAFL